MKILTTRLTGAAWILVCLFWATGNLLWATPQQTVSGTVTDTQDNPIPGVSIRLLNSNTGTQTDLDGAFSIQAQPGDTLSISYLGFKTLRIPIGNQTTFTIAWQQDITALGEVTINAGYYNTTRRKQTGSIARVTADEIERQPVTNPLAALQGRMPGVFITQNTGVPGGGFQIQIRGQNSLRDDGNQPLYIIDGVPYSSESIGDASTNAAIAGGISPLNTIDPASIASIVVLKDADATAIYGSRGANGVVLITTKKGSAGDTRFQVGYRYGVAQVTSHLDLLNTQQYLEVRREAFANDGITDYPANAYDINGTWDENRYTDWQKVFIGGSATYTDVDASVSGGSEQTRFRLGGNYHRETTVYPGDFAYQKLGIQSQVGHTGLDGKFSLDLSNSFSYQRNSLPGTSLLGNILRLAPNAPQLYTEEGNLNWENSTWTNPLSQFEKTYLSDTYNLITNLKISYQILPGLLLSSSFGYTDIRFNDELAQPHTQYDPALGYDSSRSMITKSQNFRKSWIAEPQLNYTKQIKDFKLDVLAGTTLQNQTSHASQYAGLGFSNNNLISNLGSANAVAIGNDTQTQYKYSALYGRINLAFEDRYYLNLTGRRDGSSRFGPGKQFSNFGAVGAAWVFSAEEALADLTLLSFGKLRGSYGSTGNDQIGDYQYLDTYTLTGSTYGGVSVLEPSRLFNPDFSWETTRKLELALETGFFDDRLLFTAAWYRNRSSNQLVGIPLPGTTGFSSVQANLNATVENRGWEFNLTAIPLNGKKLYWETNLNLSISRNELLEFPDLEGSTYANQYIIGEPLNIRKTYQYEGIDTETGLFQFTDFNEDGNLTAQDDRESIKDLNPVFFGGIQNSLRYKNFSLDFLVQVVKQDNYRGMYLTGYPGSLGSQTPEVLNRWQQPGDEAGYQKYTSGRDIDVVLSYLRYNQSDAMITDASYIRLKNISLSYSLPQDILPGITGEFFLQGQNLLTITSYEGFDPESIYISSLPPLQVFTTGVRFNF